MPWPKRKGCEVKGLERSRDCWQKCWNYDIGRAWEQTGICPQGQVIRCWCWMTACSALNLACVTKIWFGLQGLVPLLQMCPLGFMFTTMWDWRGWEGSGGSCHLSMCSEDTWIFICLGWSWICCCCTLLPAQHLPCISCWILSLALDTWWHHVWSVSGVCGNHGPIPSHCGPDIIRALFQDLGSWVRADKLLWRALSSIYYHGWSFSDFWLPGVTVLCSGW